MVNMIEGFFGASESHLEVCRSFDHSIVRWQQRFSFLSWIQFIHLAFLSVCRALISVEYLA